MGGAISASFLRPDTVFLVFEWATLGSLLDYLQANLTGEAKDWELIFNLMEDLAVGLNDLHERLVIHR